MKKARSGAIKPNSLKGTRNVLIHKNRPQQRFLRRLGEYLLYSRLRSLIPSQPLKPTRRERSPRPHEIRKENCEDENADGEAVAAEGRKEYDGKGQVEGSETTGGPSGAFVPSINIRKMDSCLLISTIALKDVALSSALFQLLEEEKVDIVFENHYRTETKVVHTIQANWHRELDVDALERKLHAWAGKRS